MASDTERGFVQALRSLDRGEFLAFVAALWAARGWETKRLRTGEPIEVRREGSGRRSIRIVAGVAAWPVVVRLLLWPTDSDADVVVTRGRLAATAVDRIGRLRGRAAFEHVPVDELYRRFRYGLSDGERSRLRGEFFEGSFEDSTTFEDSILPGGRTPSTRLDDVLDCVTPVIPSGVPPGVVLVGSAVVALIVAGVVIGPFAVLPPDGDVSAFSSGGAGAAGSTASPVDVRTPGPAPPELTPSATVPPVCPTPPADAHPAAIRPGVVRTASTSGLEGWAIRFEETLTDFDPNDESNEATPEIRHLVVYETPSERRYRLVVDRWGSAERAMEVERGDERTALVWGAYSVVVESYTADAPGRIATDARTLLVNVRTPGGITIGTQCVDALTGNTNPVLDSVSVPTSPAIP